jgi:prepilin-type N-terminal cleavage/methylation domain-containing protein
MPASTRHLRPFPKDGGFGLIEVLVSLAIFAVAGVTFYQFFGSMLTAIQSSRTRLAATEILAEQIEIIRNLPYDDVGVSGGIPDGVLDHLKTEVREALQFSVTTTVRNIDDEFDGTIGGSPNDLSPTDYKLIEIEVACTSCEGKNAIDPVSFTTTQAPKGLETASDNGAIFVRVLDSEGLGVPEASITIINAAEDPDIVIVDTTDNDGWLRIIDAPPGVEVYEITATKDGFSTDQTYDPNDPENPNPTKPHATVALQSVTQISFSIDEEGAVAVTSTTGTCAATASVLFDMTSLKTIGTDPDVPKYSESLSTDGAGTLTLPGMEWGSYVTTLTDAAYDLIGLIPLNPITVDPGSTQPLQLIVAPAAPRSVMVTVKDASTQLPVTDASVTLSAGGYSETVSTGKGFLGQTDWSGGPSQEDFIDETMYFDSDGNVDAGAPAGELKLVETFGTYASSGYLTSSTFDTGSSSNFHEILWEPSVQPMGAGTDPVRFQIATNDDGLTWEYLGPDGTSSTYYTSANSALNPVHDGDRYLRYRIFLSTEDAGSTPNISDINFTHTSSCVPPGQVLFSALAPDTYSVEVTKDGYQPFLDEAVIISADWSEYVVTLSPS